MRKHAPYALVLFACAAYLVFRWSKNGAIWLVYDDAFYYFAIARNIAHGLGSTFDGVHPTNGYHPLWLLVCTIPYRLGLDDDAAVRVLLSLCTIGLGGATLLALRAIRTSALASTGLAVFMFSPYAYARFANGLESTCVLVFFVALVLRMTRVDPWGSPRARVVVSLLACGLFLSRTDGLLLIPWLAGFAWLRTNRIRPALEIALAPALLVGAYLLFNQIAFGSPTQVSGDLKRVMPSAGGVLASLAIVASPIVLLLSLRRASLLKETAKFFEATFPLAGYVACVFAYYEHMQRFAWPWYYVGPIAYLAMLVAIATGELASSALRFGKAIALSVAALVLVSSANMVRAMGTKEQWTLAETNVIAGRWMHDNMPENAVFASWDAGAIGYYSHRRVVNLDGEVSPPEYIRALAAGDPKLWTRGEHFDYIVNVEDAEDGPDRLRKTAASFLGEDRLEGATVVRSWPFVFRGYTNRHAPGEHAMAVFLMRLREAR
jgi:hypothetical protein